MSDYRARARAAASIIRAVADAIDAHENWIPADHANVRAAVDDFADGDPDDEPIVAALLDAARRETQPVPRVWLPGDTVPAGTWVLRAGGIHVAAPASAPWETPAPVVEVLVPDFAAAVAAEQARRAATDGEATE